MSKLLVKTTGDFELHPDNGEILQAFRPSVVTRNGFIDSRVGLNQIQVLHALDDSATDEEFAKAFAANNGDAAAAVKAFMAKFAPKAEVKAKPAE